MRSWIYGWRRGKLRKSNQGIDYPHWKSATIDTGVNTQVVWLVASGGGRENPTFTCPSTTVSPVGTHLHPGLGSSRASWPLIQCLFTRPQWVIANGQVTQLRTNRLWNKRKFAELLRRSLSAEAKLHLLLQWAGRGGMESCLMLSAFGHQKGWPWGRTDIFFWLNKRQKYLICSIRT